MFSKKRARKMTPSRICWCILVITSSVVLLLSWSRLVMMKLFDVESPVKHLVVPLQSKIIVGDRFGR